MAKKKIHRRPLAAKTPGSLFVHFLRSIPSLLAGNVEALFVAVGVSHVFFFLVLLGSVASFNMTPTVPFGATPSTPAPIAEEKPPDAKPVSLPSLVVYAVFTALAWGGWFWQRHALAGRMRRLVPLFYAPGTILLACLIFLHIRPLL